MRYIKQVTDRKGLSTDVKQSVRMTVGFFLAVCMLSSCILPIGDPVSAQDLVVMDFPEESFGSGESVTDAGSADFGTEDDLQGEAESFEAGDEVSAESDTDFEPGQAPNADNQTVQADMAVQESPEDGQTEAVVQETPSEGAVYVSAKILPVYASPSEENEVLLEFRFGAALERTGICDNGFTHVLYRGNSGEYEGYVRSYALSDEPLVERKNEEAVIGKDTDILDYPGRRDGEVTGEVLQEDVVTLCGSVGETWSRILFESDSGLKDGYILTSCLKGHDNDDQSQAKEGELSKGRGKGVFTDAVTGVTEATITTTNAGVLIGTPQSVGESVTLKPLGVFRITHYCSCSICCGPYANGITATGVTAVTNHTIAVSPSQIPYGSRVVINGQVYVAEDCGSAIVTNCIDVYVASHDEALAKGVFYTEVYLVQ